MEPSSTSKVAVTYWDPAALYPLIAPDLKARLPLRNLHWKSPTRPLRSISSLHVDLLPYSPPPTNLASPTPFQSTTELTRVKSTDSARSAEGPAVTRSASRSRGPRKERRHQIPGLRNTPYLKVYILRCDDNDSYKNTQRKLLREWVTTHATTERGDNHDAFEWLILHVVLPGTPAAQQPRSSSSASNPSGGSRWMKGSMTLLDKIRSDFNGSNAKIDRVAQIRIPATHPDLTTLSPPVAVTAPGTTPESPVETETAWLDLVAKLKSQILASFDARVAQYEDDVKERDSQRQLPGWNFCTFFVLKEGLARAFESVGLVEDALVLYDELGFGLEAIVREQEKGELIGGSFITWTREGLFWLEEARKCLLSRKTGDEQPPVDEIDEENPIGSEKKPYRELILSNEISIFDFRCYLFARQATLLLRLGRRNGDHGIAPPKIDDGTPAASNPSELPEVDDLPRLAEVCRRGVEFITTVSRVLRADLVTHKDSTASPSEGEPEKSVSQQELNAIVDNLVASWSYGVCQQLLSQTISVTLPEGLETNTDRGLLPQRRSSLAQPSPSFAQPARSNITGLEEIAAARADMMVLARTILEDVGKRRGWIGREGWFKLHSEEMEEVDLNADENTAKRRKHGQVWLPEGIRHKGLKEAVGDDEGNYYYRQYLELSEKAMKHYGIAKRFKNAERVESDLAALKFHLKEYETAAMHLQRMTIFYEQQGWGLIETTLLGMYAKCLKETQKSEEYVNVLLKLLTKSAALESGRIRRLAGRLDDQDRGVTPQIFSPPGVKPTTVHHVDVLGYVAEALSLSRQLGQEITTPMTNLWSDITVDSYPRHIASKDGFEVTVRLRYLLSEPLAIDRVVVKVVSAMSSQSRELLLESTAGVEMKKGTNRAVVWTNQTMPGSYIAEQMVIYAGKLKFVHEFMRQTTPDSSLLAANTTVQTAAATKKTKLSFFPAPKGLTGRLEMPKSIYLEKMRMVEIVVAVGDNQIINGELRIKSATAGLRLITASLEVVDGKESVTINEENPGTLGLKDVSKGGEIRLRLPYNSDNELSELMIRLEVNYNTIAGSFVFVDTLSVLVALPLAVNVQDIFKHDTLYSKFQVSTASGEVPLRVFTATLKESKHFLTEGGKGTTGNMTVFAKQPANFLYKIKRNKGVTGPPESLALVIEYTNMDEELRQTVATLFETEMKEAGFEEYTHWLLPSLRARFRHRTPAELERAALLEEFENASYDEYGWDEVLEAIDPRAGLREKVETWLKDFFTKHSRVPINRPDVLAMITRSITIPVDVPPLQVIHTVELNLLCDAGSHSLSAPYAPPMVTVGVALPAELIIRHSRNWDTSTEDPTAPMEFTYEVQNNPDTWLVSGRKRAHFAGVHDKVQKFSLVLVPAKSGYLVLPNIDIKPVGKAEGISLETEYKANANIVLVLPDIRSTTVRIDSVFADQLSAGPY
ncbi:hypothetical protein FPQ18DRAFT_359351 [Pyronema domesticum]|nr:hypothetical protein FPQ18DRAFT_359351 [Pyronema domesticum]